ncbi:MAG: TauD/TfdA family dioxygenase, partial [Alphaproteobacteria bacterium]
MRTSPLHEHFGIEIHDVDLRDVTAKRLYPEIRAAFEEHTLLLFRGQSLDAAEHRRIATLFGPPEDLTDAAPGATPARPMVSNLKDSGAVAAADDLQLLNLQANFIWHTDSTFLPTPAISNVLVACVLPDRGGNTEFASTRNGWAAMDPALRAAAR